VREFRSKLEDLTPAKELNFPDTAGLRPFDKYFTQASLSHHPVLPEKEEKGFSEMGPTPPAPLINRVLL
jgi:hypothetical protein